MGTNRHAEERIKSSHTTPPSGPDHLTDQDHALRAGKQGTSQRKSETRKDAATRDAGRDDRRAGSDH